MAEGLAVERDIEIAASPDTVWTLLTDPDEAPTWFGIEATFDLRHGGAYRIEVLPGQFVSGSFVEIHPPRRLVYTWGWEGNEAVPPGSTTVEFDLEPSDAGTLLRLRHGDLPTVGAARSHTSGWEHYLPRLECGWLQDRTLGRIRGSRTQMRGHERKGVTMSEHRGQALDVALAYHAAWTSRDFERAMSYIAEDVVCDAPAGRIEGADAFRDFMGPFVGILKRAELIAAFGDDTTAVVVYDTDTIPVASAPGAECVKVEDGKITYSRFIFDRAPFQAARAGAN